MPHLSHGQFSIWHSSPCSWSYLRNGRPDEGKVIDAYKCDCAIEL